jgi:hypothetical protein
MLYVTQNSNLWYTIDMFGDKNQNQAQAQPQQNQPQTQAPSPQQNAPAPNNTAGGVEDIFAETDKGDAPQAQPGQAPVPGPPTALTSGKLKPSQSSGAGSVPLSQISGKKEGFPLKKIIIIVGISLGVVGIATASYFIWKGRSSAPPAEPALGQPQNPPAVQAPPESPPDSPPTTSNGTEPDPDAVDEEQDSGGGFLDNFQQNQIDKALNPIPQDPASVDTDQDGLSDAQEFDEGTNPRLVDSDNDGLSDWEEVAIFGTNPLNIDSDGDTYIDGEEVQNGYDPLGPGKLLNFEQAKEDLE